MTWHLQWGTHVKALEKQYKRTGKKPPALARRPKLSFIDLQYEEAFSVLNHGRAWGFSAPNPIALSDVVAYLSLAGIASRPERLKYVRLIQLMDQAYIAHHAEKSSSSSGKNNNKS